MDLSRLLTSLGYGAWIPVATSVIGLFSVLAMMLPQPSPTTPAWFKVIRKFVDWVALNVGNAKNAGHPDSAPSSTSIPSKSVAALLVAMIATASLVACGSQPLQSPVVSTSSGKTQLSEAVLGGDLVRIGQLVEVGVTLMPLLPQTSSLSASITNDLSTAASAMMAAGQSLSAGGAVTGDLAANVTAADQAFKAAIAAVQTIDAGLATKLSSARVAFLSAVTLYDTDAAALGDQTIVVPAV